MTYQPYEIINSAAKSQWLVICDHATNVVPDIVNGGDLGIAAADMQRHIAYDIGPRAWRRRLALFCRPLWCVQIFRVW